MLTASARHSHFERSAFVLGGLARACLCLGRGREGGTHKHTKAVEKRREEVEEVEGGLRRMRCGKGIGTGAEKRETEGQE